MAFTPIYTRPSVLLQGRTSEVKAFETMLYQADADIDESANDDIGSKIERMKENMLSGEFGSRGEQYFVAQVAVVLCIFYGNVPLLGELVVFLFGPCLTLIGACISFLGVKDLGKNLSPWPSAPEKSELVNTGVYSEIRHPIYTGLLSFCLGISIWSGSAMRVLLTVVLWLVLEKKSTFEEETLIAKFGQSYKAYKDDVPKFLPTKVFRKVMESMSLKSNA